MYVYDHTPRECGSRVLLVVVEAGRACSVDTFLELLDILDVKREPATWRC